MTVKDFNNLYERKEKDLYFKYEGREETEKNKIQADSHMNIYKI
jgi:hypothetical protein